MIGDFALPATEPPGAFALPIHKAAGNRTPYATMAEAAAETRFAAIREGSKSADLFLHNPELHLRLIDWIEERMPAAAEPCTR
ncbi:MAG: hypothetical protein OEV69_12485 [Gammaproteobacteria bacterium]|nr:hypothetical protein [Gammaproteobacteria bacterium]